MTLDSHRDCLPGPIATNKLSQRHWSHYNWPFLTGQHCEHVLRAKP